MVFIFVAIVFIAAILLIKVIGIQSSTIKKIVNPKLGVLNLLEKDFNEVHKQDIQILASLFFSCEESRAHVPNCDVLLLYCHIDSAGSIRGLSVSFSDVVRSSTASVVIIATEHNVEQYKALTKNEKLNVNLVMTLDRKGQAFTKFFKKLFEEMSRGISMPQAWVRLSPQCPNLGTTDDCPITIMSCGAGQVSFSSK